MLERWIGCIYRKFSFKLLCEMINIKNAENNPKSTDDSDDPVRSYFRAGWLSDQTISKRVAGESWNYQDGEKYTKNIK